MPVKAHAQQHSEYRGTTSHHNWNNESHHNFNHDSHKVLLVLLCILIVAIVLMLLSQI